MKKRIHHFLFIAFFFLLFVGCNDSKQTKTEGKEDQSKTDQAANKKLDDNTVGELKAPDFNDAELKRYYGVYTAYLNKVVTSIQNKDEVGTMKLFDEEGGQFQGKNEIDQKAQSAEREVFNAWLMESFPYQKIIIGSDYYKKFNEEHYKKVKEKFEKKGY